MLKSEIITLAKKAEFLEFVNNSNMEGTLESAILTALGNAPAVLGLRLSQSGVDAIMRTLDEIITELEKEFDSITKVAIDPTQIPLFENEKTHTIKTKKQ
jgi:hypothetical protein